MSDETEGALTPVWPLFGLRLRTPRLELRLPREPDLLRLAAATPDDLETDPSWPPIDGSPQPIAAAIVQGHWRALGQWKVDSWRLPLAVWAEGDLVGVQELEGNRFPTLRTVETSSWLTPGARGKGIGKEMRAAVLSLAFDHLGAQLAASGAWETNAASLGVSRALGYVDNGWHLHEHVGTVGRMRQVLLERSQWDGARWPLSVEGLDECRPWFGG